MVVVGSSGSPRWARWAAARSAYGCERRPSASVTAAARARTAGAWVRADVAREARSARFAASSAATVSVPCASPSCQGHQLRGLLLGEGQPAGDLRVDLALDRGVQRHMQQRAGRGHIDPVGEAEQGAEGGQRVLQIVDPDVAAVDHARHQALTRESADGRQRVEVGRGRVGEVERQTVHRSLGQDGQGVAEPVEVRGDQELRAVGEGAQIAVGARGGVQLGRRAVLDEAGSSSCTHSAPAARRSARTSA